MQLYGEVSQCSQDGSLQGQMVAEVLAGLPALANVPSQDNSSKPELMSCMQQSLQHLSKDDDRQVTAIPAEACTSCIDGHH